MATTPRRPLDQIHNNQHLIYYSTTQEEARGKKSPNGKKEAPTRLSEADIQFGKLWFIIIATIQCLVKMSWNRKVYDLTLGGARLQEISKYIRGHQEMDHTRASCSSRSRI